MSGANITIIGDDGIGYTLHTIEREIRFSTGEVLVLNADQFDAVYPEFIGTIEADQLEPQMQTLPNYYSDPNCVPNPEQGVYCTYRTAPPTLDLSQVEWWFAPDDEKKPKKPKNNAGIHDLGDSYRYALGDATPSDASRSVTPVYLASYTPDTFSLAAAAIFQSSSHCNQIATLALQVVADFRDRRTGWIRDVFQVAAVVITGVYTRRWVPTGGLAGTLLSGRLGDRSYARIRMSLIAVDWNSYNCGNYNVSAGPIWINGGQGGGGTPNCYVDDVVISYNGTNFFVRATICEMN